MKSISKYLSANTAKLCGLEKRKGALQSGLDADLVFFEPEATFEVATDIIRHKNKVIRENVCNLVYKRIMPGIIISYSKRKLYYLHFMGYV